MSKNGTVVKRGGGGGGIDDSGGDDDSGDTSLAIGIPFRGSPWVADYGVGDFVCSGTPIFALHRGL